jgi:hypothetical protein
VMLEKIGKTSEVSTHRDSYVREIPSVRWTSLAVS